jgi:4-hydroxy-tetrahydrodipicolinate synthase
VKLHGIIPPLATPLDDRGAIDVGSLRRLVAHQLDGGVDGLFLFGSTGEGPLLSDAERAVVLREVVESVAGRVPILAGVMDATPARVVAHAASARELGADAVVAVPPFYFTHSQLEILSFFRELARMSPLPVVAYNIPVFVKTSFEPATIETLAREGAIVGLKDSALDLAATRQIIVRTADLPDFVVMTGLEQMVDVAVQMGMAGAVPGLANVAPRSFATIYAAAKAGDYARARQEQERMVRLMDIVRQAHSGQSFIAGAFSGFKTALTLLGVIESSRMHAPLSELSVAEAERVGAVLREVGLL